MQVIRTEMAFRHLCRWDASISYSYEVGNRERDHEVRASAYHPSLHPSVIMLTWRSGACLDLLLRDNKIRAHLTAKYSII